MLELLRIVLTTPKDPQPMPPQNLETRQLVVKNPVVFAPPGGAITVSSVLHLPRYQPAVKLGPGQMFKVRPEPWGSGGEVMQ